MKPEKKELAMVTVIILMVLVMFTSLLLVVWQNRQVAPENTSAATDVKAFPSAMGQGKMASGGRGGRIIKVTNHNNGGEGSLRAALEAEGPRIVIFDVGGEIDLEDSIVIYNGDLTVAGQTAPYPGVNIKGGDLRIKGDNIIIRHIAVRPGSHRGKEYDSIQLSDGASNIILDHISLSFSIDEVFSTHFSTGHFLTLQNSIVAYPLNCSIHSKGCHGYNFLMSGDSKNLSLINNLVGFATDRNPRVKDEATIEVIGNYFYKIKAKCVATEDPRTALVDNVYENAINCNRLCENNAGKFYTKNNTCDGQPIDVDTDDKLDAFVFPLATGSGLKGDDLKEYLFLNAGKTKPRRDDLDKLIVNNFRSKSTDLIDKPNELGGGYDLISPKKVTRAFTDNDGDGIPNNWEEANDLNPNNKADGSLKADNGYTNVENYLNAMAGDNVGACTPDCSQKSCGDDGCGGSCGNCGTDKKCQAGQCIDKPLDPEELPVCTSLRADKTTVNSKDEKIKITARGKKHDDSELYKIQIFTGPAGQTNKKPDDFICTGEDTADEQYSYYCNGLDAWHILGNKTDTNEYVVETTFSELLQVIIDGKGKPYAGNLDDKGVLITANVHGDSEADNCSSNISLNDGKGAYYNNGNWDISCDGGCNLHILYDPDPEKPPVCNDSCTNDTECPSNLTCTNGFCRDAECEEEDDCACPPPQCNDECSDDTDCPDNLKCSNNKCRKEECEGEADCSCPNDPPPKCNSECSGDSDCPSNLSCHDNKCREDECTDETDCSCNETPEKSTDLNDDGKVDMLDISQVLSKWGEDVSADDKEDLNNDGNVDMLDVSNVLADWTG